jgi:hypothetical protein
MEWEIYMRERKEGDIWLEDWKYRGERDVLS